MAVSPDIQRAIEIIDQRMQSLQRIKDMLLKEFGAEEAQVPDLSSDQTQITRRTLKKSKTRRDTLNEFLKLNGPTSRADIQYSTGMPRGTLAFLLNDKKSYKRLPEGKWALREDERIS